MEKKICDYCGKEMKNSDIVFDGYDYCCDICAAGRCEICNIYITPRTFKEYSGKCISCSNKK